MVKPRKDELDRLNEEQAADETAMVKLRERMAKRKEKIDPKKEERTDEENRFLGEIARVLVEDDSSLKRRFVQQAAKMYTDKATNPRRNLERVLGKIPVIQIEEAKPKGGDSAEQAAA